MSENKKIKNKKLQKIRNTNFNIKLKRSKKTKDLFLYIEMDSALEPAIRPKHTSKSGFIRMYDPLASYKQEIEFQIKKFIESLDDKYKKIFPYNGPVSSNILIVKKPSKSHSALDKFNKIKNKLPILMKPDLDNINKTIWDCLNNIVFKDDSLIFESKCKKLYGEKEYSIIKIYFRDSIKNIEKDFKENNKRLNSEQLNYIKKLYEYEDE